MIHQLIDPAYYRSLLLSPGPFMDGFSYLVACIGLILMIAPCVTIGAFLFRLTPTLGSTLNAYCRSRIAWAYGCLFAMMLCVIDLSFVVFSKRLPSSVTVTPYYCTILLLMIG